MPFKIGPINLGIKLARLPQNGGELLFRIEIFSEAKIYTSILIDPINFGEITSKFEMRAIVYEDKAPNYGLNPVKEMILWRRLAYSASSDAARAVERIAFFNQFRLDIKTISYGLLGEIMRMVQIGASDELSQIDLKDISENTVEERAATAERMRLDRLAEIAHQEEEARRLREYQRHALLAQKYQKQAEETSLALLFSRLNDAEKAEAIYRKQITVYTPEHGDFIIPLGFGHVHRRVDNRCVASYCLMFEDSSLPIYDTILMKILLLKNDPERFIKTSNSFPATQETIAGTGILPRRRRRRRQTA